MWIRVVLICTPKLKSGFFQVLLAKMVRLDKKIISAKYYLFTTILTSVTRTVTVKITMFEYVCDCTV